MKKERNIVKKNERINTNNANVVANNNSQPTPETNTLANMAGVKIAPIDSKPIDASKHAQQQASQPPVVTEQPTVVATQQQTQQEVVNTNVPSTTPEQQLQQPATDQTANTPVEEKQEEQPKKKKSSIVFLLILVIVAMGGYIYYLNNDLKAKTNDLYYNYTPRTSLENEIELDLNSTLVKDLYKKVQTNIREDVAQPYFNYNLKLYLAYRQILETDKYTTNCNMYNEASMEPYKCEVTSNFTPLAFNASILETEYKKLFGESDNFQFQNIQLGSSCVGGYQYVEARGEYVQGYCEQSNAIFYKVNKELIKATSYRNTIVLEEKVQYIGNENMEVPNYLISGVYKYVFRLDMNYNYTLLSKTYIEQY